MAHIFNESQKEVLVVVLLTVKCVLPQPFALFSAYLCQGISA